MRARPQTAVAFMALLLAALVAIGSMGCSGTSTRSTQPMQDSLAAIELDRFFLAFRQKVQDGKSDSLVRDLSRDTRFWMEDIRQAARTEGLDRLQERPFAEILAILALRQERRQNPAFDDRLPGLVWKLVVSGGPVRKTLLKSELGPSRVRGRTGELGLREAPSVPVFHFTKEDGRWTFHMARSLPVIMQGAEFLARQRKSTRLEQAVYILEQFGGRRVEPEDLRR